MNQLRPQSINLTNRKRLEIDGLTMGSVLYECGFNVIAFYRYAVACISRLSGELQWVIGPRDDLESIVYPVDDDVGFVLLDGGIQRVNLANGEMEYAGIGYEVPVLVTPDYLFTLKVDDALRCLNTRTLECIWEFSGQHAGHNDLRVGDGVVVLQDLEAFHGIDIESGDLLWEFRRLSWLESRYADRLDKRRNRPGGVSPSEERRGPPCKLGPVVDGKVFLSYDFGLMVALDVRTGESLWETSLKSPVTAAWLPMARYMCLRDGKLYFNDNQGAFGKSGTLHCLDAETGQIEFQLDEPFTPSGCAGSVMIDKYFVGGSRHHIAAYDVEAREYVWRYEHKEAPIFSSQPVRVPGGFLIASGRTQELIWFQSDDDQQGAEQA
ncbi:outer membrane protein assembly factor BamB family protein [Arhodomonas sp. AD133]|uniref:outer membrane protein assembly factor BamB family protein n=1 Tax=Arhodomonas sp. AD133 TaxID=3415009 RepID=UPI003EBB114F